MRTTITILNGPNLNMLGQREPEIYGHVTLADIEALCAEAAAQHGFTLVFKQTNHEGELVEWTQAAGRDSAGLIINAGAYTHTSVALHDALKTVGVPIIEVHISNIYQREPFRHHSYISPLAKGVICGLGPQGYVLAIAALAGLK
ncbi:MAG: type II 3-dehydroquinate dehydratase [Pseudomonadota bacterium]